MKTEGATFKKAIRQLESILNQDPRIEEALGTRGPRELLFTQRVVEWVRRLEKEPSEALVLAAWGHVLERWKMPRGKYPTTTTGYHAWRQAQATFSAERTAEVLREGGYDEATTERVKELILKKTFPQDPESRTFEDASCLAFLEMKLEGYMKEWEEEGKALRILKGTLEKMTPRAREEALKIPFSRSTLEWIGKALAELKK